MKRQNAFLLLEKERTDVVNRGRDDKTIEVHFYITKSMDNILKKKILDNTYYDFFMQKLIRIHKKELPEDKNNRLDELQEIKIKLEKMNFELKKMPIEKYFSSVKNYLIEAEKMICLYEQKYFSVKLEKRNKNIKFRVTEQDYDFIQMVCEDKKLNMSELFISCILQKRYIKEKKMIIRKEFFAIKSILNRFTKRFNFFNEQKELYQECKKIKQGIFRNIIKLQENI